MKNLNLNESLIQIELSEGQLSQFHYARKVMIFTNCKVLKSWVTLLLDKL